ncbi:hypothetical protein OpiT1DRAFT_05206 [Opitutaceae bacterium TAV1]|nr:hypothetical protein OpiT1DRAFT_05206 [Opitutaceae bacterium TAV1]
MKIPGIPELKITALFAACALAVGAQASAATLYWNANSGNGEASTRYWANGTSNWSTLPDGAANTKWNSTTYDTAEITKQNAEIILRGITSLSIGNLVISPATTLRLNSYTGGNPVLTLTTSGSGNLEWQGVTAGTARFILSNTSAWDGTITDTSTVATSNIDIDKSTATSVSTRIALNGAGKLRLTGNTTGQTVIIGELSGNSADATVSSTDATGTRHLRIEQSSNTTYAGKVLHGGRSYTFEKAGEGRLRLTGDLTQAAGASLSTLVSGGELYLNGTSAELATVTIASDAILGGTGTIALKADATVTVEDGGILNPGDISDLGIATTGTLTISGTSGAGLVFTKDATIKFNLNGDKIVLHGDTLVGSAAADSVITFDFTDSSASVVGSTIDLIDFGGTTPGIGLARFAASEGWTGNFLYGGDGNLLQFQVIGAPIPEPAIVALILGLGCMVSFLGFRRH